MGAKYETIFKNDTISLSKGQDGYWLYDKTRGMNLAMRAESERDAFIKTITYYQNRLIQVEKEYRQLENKVNGFVSQFVEID